MCHTQLFSFDSLSDSVQSSCPLPLASSLISEGLFDVSEVT